MKAVIICGGVGSKMWPESRSKSPKHFLPLLNGKSLFELNWEALRSKFSANDIFLQTNAVQAEMAMKVVPEIVKENIFIEPEMRNHGPATGFAAASLIKRGFGDETFILVQADVLRKPEEKFVDMMETIDALARENGVYITGGIVPDRVIRGVDYLVKGELVKEEKGVKVYKVAEYIDRTEEEKIQKYLGGDKLLLHANHTTMTPNNLLEMYKKYRMDWYEPLMAMVGGADEVAEYSKMPKGQIEEVTKLVYGSGGALVVELPFEWIDFGTWESVAKYLVALGEYSAPKGTIEIEGSNNFIRAPEGKRVALVGVENLVVIDSADALMITAMDKTGMVGQIVDKLKEEGASELV